MHNEKEEKITLDMKAFKTLASETRVGILKSLSVRRKTLSELAKEYRMSVSTIKEHLDNMVAVGLIEQKDDGHKWKYYELTEKGTGVLNPEERKVWILLSLSAFAALLTSLDAMTGFVGKAFSSQRNFDMLTDVMGSQEAPLLTSEGAVTGAVSAVPWAHVAFGLAFSLLAAFFAFRLIKSRRDMSL